MAAEGLLQCISLVSWALTGDGGAGGGGVRLLPQHTLGPRGAGRGGELRKQTQDEAPGGGDESSLDRNTSAGTHLTVRVQVLLVRHLVTDKPHSARLVIQHRTM